VLTTLDSFRPVNSQPGLSKDIIEIEQLGDQHRAIRHLLESCEDLLDLTTYESLADLHDSLVSKKKKLISTAMRNKSFPSLRVVKN
jgi:hypothetical protein